MEILARALAWFTIVCVSPPSAVLVFVAETGRGRVLGVAGLLLAAACFVATTRRWRASILLFAAASIAVVGLAVTIPANGPSPGFEGTPIEAGVGQLVPEVDQVRMGIAAAVIVDPFVDRAQARRIVDVTLPIYREIPEHPRTALAYGFAEVFGGREDGHRYYKDPKRPGATVLIFLHGSAGNFASYARVLSALDAVVVCPTAGFGLYLDSDRTRRIVEDARRFAVESLGGDPERVFVAALSQGGVAGLETARSASWVRGLVLISAVMDAHLVREWSGPPVHVLHGDADRRIPVDVVRERVAEIATTATVSATYYAGEDHFLMFARREEVVAELARILSVRVIR